MKLNRRTFILLLVCALILFVAVATVSAADVASDSTAVAAVNMQGAEGITIDPVAGTDQRLFCPWEIDATNYVLY